MLANNNVLIFQVNIVLKSFINGTKPVSNEQGHANSSHLSMKTAVVHFSNVFQLEK